MTSKGQVLIPKDIRDRTGLVPGRPVKVGVNDRGEVVVLPPDASETPEQRRTRIQAAIQSVRGTANFGMSTDEYMAMIRGPYEDGP
jgi:AbrB family looped-hinge helix DNA binding protein